MLPDRYHDHQPVLTQPGPRQAAFPRPSLAGAPLAFSSPTLLRRARTFPLVECWISPHWQQQELGLVKLLLARQQPDGALCFGVYLLDTFCLGLKKTFAAAGVSRMCYEHDVRRPLFPRSDRLACSAELAHQMIYASIEYAAQFGFQPAAAFALTRYVLSPRGHLAEPYPLTFGKQGQPFFVAGPADPVAAILEQLEQTAGAGQYAYAVPQAASSPRRQRAGGGKP